MFSKSFIPYKGYWSSPFCRWQGQLQDVNAVSCAAASAKNFLQDRKIGAESFDEIILGSTVPQKQWFFSTPHLAKQIGITNASGPMISQACATSAVSVAHAAFSLETGMNKTVLVVAADRTSNSPVLVWPKASGFGGTPEIEKWMESAIALDPAADTSALQTAENVAKEHGVTREESDAMALSRYVKYEAALADDRKFQKKYMTSVEVRLSKSKSLTVDCDEGVLKRDAAMLSGLRPTLPDGILTTGAQTFAADGNAGMIVTTKEQAAELSSEKITVQLLTYAYAKTKKAFMPAAVVPCAEKLIKNAGLTVSGLGAVKTHNPFSVNDIVLQKSLKIDEKIFNNYGSSLIFGHPQGPTGLRCMMEMIEELVEKGGGYGLFVGCAAGDIAAGWVLKVG